MKSKRAEASAFETYKKGSSGGERPRAGPGPIETVDLRSLRLARRNARTHSKKQIRQIRGPLMARSPLQGRRIHIAGSIVEDVAVAAGEDVRQARELVAELVKALVRRGANFVVPVD